MKQQVFYIHGGSAYDAYEDFLADLRDQPLRDLPGAEKKSKWTSSFSDNLGDGYEVFMPTMPNKQNAQYKEWKIWFERYFEYLTDGAILIGCSLGGYFLVKYLSENKLPFTAKSLIVMAAPFANFHNSALSRERGGDFEPKPDNLHNIYQSVEQISLLHSKDDFVVPYEHALKYKEALPEAELITFADKNHFLVEELPELIDIIHTLG